MSVIEFDYGALKSVIKTTNKMSGGWGVYGSYRSDLKGKLHNSLSEWKLAGSEPLGHTYVVDAQGKVNDKRDELEDRMKEWSTLSSNLSNFKDYVEGQDKAVQEIFETTSNQYTDYSGIGGLFTWLGDAFFSAFGVDFVNSNQFTRSIADWGKRAIDDLDTVKREAFNWFKHGKGKYYLNIATTWLCTGAAVAGAVIAFCAIPFTGGTSAAIAVGFIGFAASTGLAGISIFNSVHTSESNAEAIKYEGNDPGKARFNGNVSSYSERVNKTIWNSPEEYQKHAKLAKGIDVAEDVCTVVSVAAGLTSTFGTKTELVYDPITGDVNPTTRMVHNLGEVKSNVLKTFGIKVKETEKATRYLQPGTTPSNSTVQEGIQFNSNNLSVANPENGNKTIKYTQRSISQRTTEYKAITAGDGTIKTIQVKPTTKTIDFTKAVKSQRTLDKISYYKNLQDPIKAGKSITKLHVEHYAKGTKAVLEGMGSVTKGLSSTEGKTANEIVKELAKKNKFLGSFDKYIYSIQTGTDAEGWRGIGGSNMGKLYDVFVPAS